LTKISFATPNLYDEESVKGGNPTPTTVDSSNGYSPIDMSPF